MTCVYTPQIALFGSNDEIALFSANDDIATFYEVPCTATLRDEFACCALSALGGDNNYNLTRTDANRQQAVIDAYMFADLMLAYRQL